MFSPATHSSLPTHPISLHPRRVLDRTSTQIMTSPASLFFFSALCSNSSCASRGGLTPAWSLASWMLPGKPWITGQVWKGADVSRGTAHHEGLVSLPGLLRCYLQILGGKSMKPTTALQKDETLLLLLNYLLIMFFLPPCFRFSLSPLCYSSHAHAYSIMLKDFWF